MTLSSTPDETLYRAALARVFPGSTPRSCQPMSGGVSAGAMRWDVLHPDGTMQRLVLRRPRASDPESSLQCAEREARLLRSLDDTMHAPKLVAFDVDGLVLVLEYVEGAPCFTMPPSHQSIEELADQLAAIHQRCADDGLDFLPWRVTSVRARLEAEPDCVDEALDERRVRDALCAHEPRGVNAPVLLHGDYWPGNILWKDGAIAAVIDWEESERGDPLSDLGVARLDLLWAFGAAAMDRFTQRYLGRMKNVCADDLAWWDLVAALRPMSQLSRWASAYSAPPVSRPDITEHSMRRDHRWFAGRAIDALQRCDKPQNPAP